MTAATAANIALEGEPEVSPLKTLTFGKLIDDMYALRLEKEELTSAAKKLGTQLDLMQAEIIDRLDADETTMSRGKLASAILTETVVPKVDDWDGFYQYIHDNEAFHLLQRRLATTAYREMLEAGEVISGVSTFTKRAISLRKIT